jgi:hypothetical protein
MSQNDEYQRLASQFVDMWQKNMASMMNDSEFIRSFLQMMQASSLSAKDSASYDNRYTQTSAGTATAPDTRHDAFAGVTRRLAAVETRLAALEDALARLLAAGKTAKRVARPAKRPATRKGSGSRGTKKNR